MKKIIFCILTSLLLVSFVGCLPSNSEETISLNSDNFYDYFDVSVEYYNYTDTSTEDTVIAGAFVPGMYKANVSQRVKIIPKENVVSCENVIVLHSASNSTLWSYSSSNKGNTSENSKNNSWTIYLSENGEFDGSKTMYYCNMLDPASCPTPSSKLIIVYKTDVSGTVTIKK